MPAARSWQVHKFGGTSVQDAGCFQRVADILLEEDRNKRKRLATSLTSPGSTSCDLGKSLMSGCSSLSPGQELSPQTQEDSGQEDSGQEQEDSLVVSTRPQELQLHDQEVDGGRGDVEMSSEHDEGDGEQSDEDSEKPEGGYCVVVSAMGGSPKTTNLLLELVKRASRNEDYREVLDQIEQKHLDCLWELFGVQAEQLPAEADSGSFHDSFRSYRNFIEKDHLAQRIKRNLQEIETLLNAIQILRMEDKKIQGLIAGYGELWSAQILTRLLQNRSCGAEREQWCFVDARDVVTLDEGDHVVWEASLHKLQKNFFEDEDEELLLPRKTKSATTSIALHKKNLVVTGFIASYQTGGATTLGRDGSDYSASIFARLLQAKSIAIWTDVSGVFSADPRRVPDAYVLPDVSYHEATELAYFGAKVIHPKTMRPAQDCGIPIFLKNTFEPQAAGTRIFKTSPKTLERPVCGFNVSDGISLLNVECAGMITVPGIFARLFTKLANDNIGIQLISQAATESSICFAVNSFDAVAAVKSTEQCFSEELRCGDLQQIHVTQPCSVVAVVGDGMRMRAGIAGKFFTAFKGSSETNISAVVPSEHAARALRAVHSEFLTKMNIGVVLLCEDMLLGEINDLFSKKCEKKAVELIQKLQKALDGEGSPNTSKTEARGSNTSCSRASKSTSAASSTCDFRVLGAFVSSCSSRRPPEDRGSNNSDLEIQASWFPTPNAADFGADSRELELPLPSPAQNSEKQKTQLFQRLSQTAYKFAHQVIVVDLSSNNTSLAKMHPNFLREGFHVVSHNSAALGGSVKLYKEITSQAATNANTRFLDEGAARCASHLRRKLSRSDFFAETSTKLTSMNSFNGGDRSSEPCASQGGGSGCFGATAAQHHALFCAAAAASESNKRKKGAGNNASPTLSGSCSSKPPPNPISTSLYSYGGSLVPSTFSSIYPLEATIAHLQNSGDRIVKIHGTAFCAGLNFILEAVAKEVVAAELNTCTTGAPPSAASADDTSTSSSTYSFASSFLRALKAAVANGFFPVAFDRKQSQSGETEEEELTRLVRVYADELSGRTVAQRLVTVARRIGLGLEVEVEGHAEGILELEEENINFLEAVRKLEESMVDAVRDGVASTVGKFGSSSGIKEEWDRRGSASPLKCVATIARVAKRGGNSSERRAPGGNKLSGRGEEPKNKLGYSTPEKKGRYSLKLMVDDNSSSPSAPYLSFATEKHGEVRVSGGGSGVVEAESHKHLDPTAVCSAELRRLAVELGNCRQAEDYEEY